MADEQASVTYEKGRLYSLPVADILPNPNQPRKYFDEDGLAELTQSIADRGVLQPILVCLETDGNDPQKIILIAGERRLKAAQNAGLTEILALFVDDNPEEVALIENSLRENLTAIEEAEAAGRLATELNYTQVQLCKILGKKPSPSHRPASPYRSVNIAMANELKMLFDRMDIDIWEVRSCHFLVGK